MERSTDESLMMVFDSLFERTKLPKPNISSCPYSIFGVIWDPEKREEYYKWGIGYEGVLTDDGYPKDCFDLVERICDAGRMASNEVLVGHYWIVERSIPHGEKEVPAYERGLIDMFQIPRDLWYGTLLVLEQYSDALKDQEMIHDIPE